MLSAKKAKTNFIIETLKGIRENKKTICLFLKEEKIVFLKELTTPSFFEEIIGNKKYNKKIKIKVTIKETIVPKSEKLRKKSTKASTKEKIEINKKTITPEINNLTNLGFNSKKALEKEIFPLTAWFTSNGYNPEKNKSTK